MSIQNNQYPSVEGYIKEEREGFLGDKKTDELQCTAILQENLVFIEKRSMLRGKPRGEKKILYNDIVTVDYDKSGFLKTDGIQILIHGFVITIRNKNNGDYFQQFYEMFVDKVHKAKESANAPVSQESEADILAKFYDLKEKGIISEEEFEHKKKEIIGL